MPEPGASGIVRRLLARVRAALERRLLGTSADEIRYTFEDVRAELRATRAELKTEIAALRRDLERLEHGDEPQPRDQAQEKPAAKV